MELAEAREMLLAAEKALETERYVVAREFNRNGRCLELILAARLLRALRRAKLSRSKEVLTALKNASYGFDSAKMRSEAGRGVRPPHMVCPTRAQRSHGPATALTHDLCELMHEALDVLGL